MAAEDERPGGGPGTIVSDTADNQVRVVAASMGTIFGRAMTARGHRPIAGTGIAWYSGDGGPATSAELNNPVGVAVDGTGNVLIADSSNNRIRVATATTGAFYGQAMTARNIDTFAGNGTAGFSGDGGTASSAELSAPIGVAVDSAGTVLIVDEGNHRVRVVTG